MLFRIVLNEFNCVIKIINNTAIRLFLKAIAIFNTRINTILRITPMRILMKDYYTGKK